MGTVGSSGKGGPPLVLVGAGRSREDGAAPPCPEEGEEEDSFRVIWPIWLLKAVARLPRRRASATQFALSLPEEDHVTDGDDEWPLPTWGAAEPLDDGAVDGAEGAGPAPGGSIERSGVLRFRQAAEKGTSDRGAVGDVLGVGELGALKIERGRARRAGALRAGGRAVAEERVFRSASTCCCVH